MIDFFLPPAFIFIVGCALVPFFKGTFRNLYVCTLPLVGLLNLLAIPMGTHYVVPFLNFKLGLLHVDKISFLFGLIFHIAAFITVIYMLNVKKNTELMSGLFYAGAALGAIFARDLITFFIFWEMLNFGAMFLILERRTKQAQGAALRYVLMHVVGGLVLLAGIMMFILETGSTQFGYIGLSSLSTYLIFLGFGLNCGWPLLHTWITDAYPEATVGGAVFLSAITTKVAVYALVRAFPGADPLIWIGTAMAAFPIFYAVVENDLRRVLAYSLINQVGFMVVGIGIGTHLAINGAVAHAFNDVLFKGLLFMSVGAVMFRTGKVNATDLGGLYRYMPWTCVFCLVGAASISAFPLFSGFVSKSMVQSAAAGGHYYFVWFVLLFAAAGVFHHAGIKIPFFAFFSHDSGLRVKEAPLNMLVAMGIASVLCVLIGIFPEKLYALLPFAVEYEPYTGSHVLAQLQLLAFSALAFCMLLRSGIYPAEMRRINLDADWMYRKGGKVFYKTVSKVFGFLNKTTDKIVVGDFLGASSRGIKNMPAKLSVAVLTPFWIVMGKTDSERRGFDEYLHSVLDRNAVPVGWVALSALCFFGALLLF